MLLRQLTVNVQYAVNTLGDIMKVVSEAIGGACIKITGIASDVVQICFWSYTDRFTHGKGGHGWSMHFSHRIGGNIDFFVELHPIGIFLMLHDQWLIDDGKAHALARNSFGVQGANT